MVPNNIESVFGNYHVHTFMISKNDEHLSGLSEIGRNDNTV